MEKFIFRILFVLFLIVLDLVLVLCMWLAFTGEHRFFFAQRPDFLFFCPRELGTDSDFLLSSLSLGSSAGSI
jgi:hypothetical protein